MSDCVFCAIAGGDLDADVIASGDDWLAFRDLRPQAPTHVLVIPRRHVSSLDALEGENRELGSILLGACREVARGEGLSDGYRVVTNVGSDGGQSVPHLHFHLLGGREMAWPPG